MKNGALSLDSASFGLTGDWIGWWSEKRHKGRRDGSRQGWRTDRKTPITAADLLNDRVVPFFDEKEVELSRVLTHREYELYLAVKDIDHSRIKTKSPQPTFSR